MFTVESVKEIKWTCPDHTQFDCVVKFAEFSEEMPFGCFLSDALQHSVELWQRVTSGEFGEIAEYVDPTPIADQPQPQVDGAQSL